MNSNRRGHKDSGRVTPEIRDEMSQRSLLNSYRDHPLPETKKRQQRRNMPALPPLPIHKITKGQQESPDRYKNNVVVLPIDDSYNKSETPTKREKRRKKDIVENNQDIQFKDYQKYGKDALLLRPKSQVLI